MIIEGTTTAVNSTNLEIDDSVITVNKGETGAGVTAPTEAGILVDRGTETDERLVWDETTQRWSVGPDGGALTPLVSEADVAGDRYSATFEVSAWTVGSPNTFVVPQATHGIEADDTYHVSVYESGQIVSINYSISAAGDVTLSTAGAPFAGKIRISL